MQPKIAARLHSGFVLMMLAMPRLADAASAVPFAAPTQFTTTGPGAGAVRMLLALALVLAAVFAAAALLRRLRGLGAVSATNLQVIAQVSLGSRERAVLLRAGNQQLLVGVAPGNVRLLCALPESLPESPALATETVAAAAALPKFRELLRRSLGR